MKKRILIIGGILFSISIIQTTLLEYFEIANIKPNLFLVFIVAVALQRDEVEAAVTGLIAGLIFDIVIGKALGLHAMLGMITAYTMGTINRKLYRENIIVLTLFTFAATCIFELLFYLMTFIVKGYGDIFMALSLIIIPEAIYNSVISIIVYPLIVRLYEGLDRLDRIHTRL